MSVALCCVDVLYVFVLLMCRVCLVAPRPVFGSVDIDLNANQTVVGDGGTLLWMQEGIKMETEVSNKAQPHHTSKHTTRTRTPQQITSTPANSINMMAGPSFYGSAPTSPPPAIIHPMPLASSAPPTIAESMSLLAQLPHATLRDGSSFSWQDIQLSLIHI